MYHPLEIMYYSVNVSGLESWNHDSVRTSPKSVHVEVWETLYIRRDIVHIREVVDVDKFLEDLRGGKCTEKRICGE